MSNSCRCAALVLLWSLIGDAYAAPTLGGCLVFPANNYWNTPVDTLPVHPSSATWVNSIGAATGLHPDWGNVLADNYGIPFVTVTGSQPAVPIAFDPNGYADESDPGPFPIPPNAPIEGGSGSDGDRHVIVVDTTNCMLYELYNAFPIGGMWLVMSDGAKTGPGRYAGTLYRNTGAAFSATPWNSSQVVTTPVGTATLTFTDTNNATFAYTVDGIAQSKAITRYVYASPATVCN